jgi:hypothetical protein
MKKHLLFLSLFIINVLIAQVPTYVPSNGLLAWYPFSGNANDESGNGNNGTVNGATLTTDRFGSINNSYQFIENTDMISIANTTINPQDFTISGWCKLNSPFVYTTFSILEIANLDYTTPGGIGLHMTQNDGIFGNGNYKVYGFSSNNAKVDSDILSYNFVSNWNHFVLVKHNGTIQLFINNLLIATSPTTQITDFANSWLQIGSRQNINNNPLSSRNIDDIGIWNRALTQEEINNLYNSSLPQTFCLPEYVPTNGLIGYWPFCGNANDESGNNLNGTVNGANLTTDRFNTQNAAYSFAENQEIFIPNTENLNTYPLTISLWYNASSLEDGMASNLFSKYVATAWNGFQIVLSDCRNVSNNGETLNNGFGVSSWYLRDNNNRVIGYYGEAPFLQQNISSNVWYHYVFTLDENGGKIYLNGQLIESHPWTGISGASTSQFLWKIGGYYNSWYKGKIDDVGVWNRILTQQEITDLNTSLSTGLTPANNQITIYPNPTKEQITIDCGTLSNASGWSYKIVNTLGQEVLNGEINSQQNLVSLNSLNGTGVYFVKIYDTSNNLLNTKKIILQ